MSTEWEIIEETEMIYNFLKKQKRWLRTSEICELLNWFDIESLRNRLRRLMREGKVEKKVILDGRKICIWKAK